ncbi:MAG: LysR family transcriptional regulator [Gammaproteobacteria bacterium]
MKGVTIHQLRCFEAVIAEGSFQAAAIKMCRAHPSIVTAVKVLEEQLGLTLLDRSGYRVTLTQAGEAFYERTQRLLSDVAMLDHFAAHLSAGDELELRVVIGDLCPLPEAIGFLRKFFATSTTRLHLDVEAIAGPVERLLDQDADLIIHYVNQSDPRLEFIPLGAVQLVPVVAPGFLDFPVSPRITHRQMSRYMQCIIRDTARHSPSDNHFVIRDAPHCTVGDQHTKREIILQAMAWGHMPTFMVQDDLDAGRLLSIEGEHFRGNTIHLVAARLIDRSHGPVAERLWRHIAEHAREWAALH